MHTSIGAVAERPFTRRLLAATAGLAFGLAAALPAEAQDTIKVGILHSLSGTMAISETTLKDVMLMLIEEQNKKGGLLGKKLEAVVVDPASNWPLFAEKARELITKDKVAVVFGCWTSVSRKSVLPVFKELNSILFYPVQYEGEESERNVFYTGAAPNQQAIPAVDYLMSKDGGEAKRWVLAGTDYVYPRTTNKILEAYLKQKGVADADIMINYTPFGHSDWQTIVSDIKKFGSAGKKTAVVSTINGDANVPFYKELGNQGVKATDIPSVAFADQRQVHRRLEGLHQEPQARHQRSDGSPRHRLRHVGEGGGEGEVDRPRQGDRRAARHRGAQPHRWNLQNAAQPPHHQAGLHRRGACGRPVRRRLEDADIGSGRCLVQVLAGLEGSGSGLGDAQMRQLQYGDQEVRWRVVALSG